MLSAVFLSASLVFSPADAKIAYEAACGLVAKCTPRDAGTIRGQIAANYLLDAAEDLTDRERKMVMNMIEAIKATRYD